MKQYKFICLAVSVSLLFGLGIYGFLIEPNWIKVNHISIYNTSLSIHLKNKVVIHLSDLHIGKLGKLEQRILDIINKLSPDLIFLTGDYVKWNSDCKPALNFIAALKAKIGIWAVMGDYDYSNSRSSCLFCHKPNSGAPQYLHNVRLLKDSCAQIISPDCTVRIFGIDSHENSSTLYESKPVAGKSNDPVIILSHDPMNFDRLPNDQNLLMLSGDTHGGQIPLPHWICSLIGYKKCIKYNYGLFQKGKKQMFVSKGIGTSHLPIRLFRRPEIVVLHFLPQQ